MLKFLEMWIGSCPNLLYLSSDDLLIIIFPYMKLCIARTIPSPAIMCYTFERRNINIVFSLSPESFRQLLVICVSFLSVILWALLRLSRLSAKLCWLIYFNPWCILCTMIFGRYCIYFLWNFLVGSITCFRYFTFLPFSSVINCLKIESML